MKSRDYYISNEMIGVKEIQLTYGLSFNKAYQLIKRINKDLERQGKLTRSGYLPRDVFEKHCK